jgi:hypothetical protein
MMGHASTDLRQALEDHYRVLMKEASRIKAILAAMDRAPAIGARLGTASTTQPHSVDYSVVQNTKTNVESMATE